MDVETPDTTVIGKLFSLTAAKGNKDAETVATEGEQANGKARPEPPDAKPGATDGEAQAGSKRTRDAAEEENPIDAFVRRTADQARKIKEKRTQSRL